MRSAMKKARYFVGIAALAGIMLAATSAQANEFEFDFNNTGGGAFPSFRSAFEQMQV